MSKVIQMTDVTGATFEVQIQIDNDGRKLWVNVDGVCRLRVSQIACPIEIDDARSAVVKRRRR